MDYPGFPGGTVLKNLPANAEDEGDLSSIPRPERSLRVGNGNLLQYACLENSMNRGTWQVTAHGVAKSWTRLSTHTMPLTIYCILGTLQTFSLILKSAGAGLEDRSALILALHLSILGRLESLPAPQTIHVRIRSASISQALLRDNSEGA